MRAMKGCDGAAPARFGSMDGATSAGIPAARLLRRFWAAASGFWGGLYGWQAWLLCLALAAIVSAQLLTQYWLNFWNRDFFNALGQKNAAALWHNSLLFFPLVALSTSLAIASVWTRMTTQRKWRRYLTRHLIDDWLANGRYRRLGHLDGTDAPQNAEYRIAEDARIATDAPVDLVLSLLTSILTVIIFYKVLSSVGGSITVVVSGTSVTIPHYLAVAVLAYSALVTTAMVLIGRRLTGVVQEQLQAEAEFRAAANLIRESGEGILVHESETEERRDLWVGLWNAIEAWRRLCRQLMRTTLVTHANILIAPVIGLLLCAPKYLGGQMQLGEVTQAAAAFATVHGACSWFVDNFQRTADWRASANRVAALLIALDTLKADETARTARHESPPGG